MSTLLWKYYFENDVAQFRQVLARATYNASAQSTRGGGSGKAVAGSPGATLAASPTSTIKSGKASTWSGTRKSSNNTTPKSLANLTLSRADINWRDAHGVTLLHHIASSVNGNASEFATALLQLSLLDLYIQDEESGWTALHRALYFGNVTIARALMNRDVQDSVDYSTVNTANGAGGLIKIKDREGNSPFDVYGASIASRVIGHGFGIPLLDGTIDEVDNDMAQGVTGDANDDDGSTTEIAPRTRIDGDEMFAFGSNKNFTLGFGDEDDRQFPERIQLKRPDHLLRRFCSEYVTQNQEAKDADGLDGRASPVSMNRLPAAVQLRPLVIQDVQLSKLHSAILTTDPESNLYMCGFGSGGRLGTGDETTRFSFVNIHGGSISGKKIISVGLGQHHTIAVSSEGETYTWGSNADGQLGYASYSSGAKDEEPVQLLPRQVFGPLKRELVVGAAASRIHSVVHTANSLYTFGKNEGQLGLVDSDARSLMVQTSPRKVAASLFTSPISAVSAIDKATMCLLENHNVWVFSNYGYMKMSFQLDGFSNYFLRSIWGPRNQNTDNHICKITSGGDTICAMSSMGDIFTVHVSQKVESSTTTASTTNPSKIRGALSAPQRIWSLKKAHMAVRDVDIGQDGSIIICTDSGSVWRRVKRAKIKDASAAGLAEHKAKDYKFSRVPGLTRISAVRSNQSGAYAAVRRDCDVLQIQIDMESKTLWKDLYPLLPFHGFGDEDSDTENPAPRFWTSNRLLDVIAIRRAVLTSTELENDVVEFLVDREVSRQSSYNVRLGTTLSDARIPIHDFILGARSNVLREALVTFRRRYFYTIPEVLTIEYDTEGKTLILFQGVDFITIFNLALYVYTDSVVDVWHHTRHAPALAYRFRQIRIELMKIALHLEMHKLEQAVRVMTAPPRTLNKDLERAIRQPDFFESGDVEIDLDGESVKVHSSLMVQRCPFFEGLFQGRAAGLWLSSRREQVQDQHDTVNVDLKHVNPRVFDFVVRHLYADADEDMFETVVSADLDAFLDLVMEVMSVANELMLDRLAQCCQKVLGRFVNTRNVCQLLNAVAPCSVTQFKNAALEYICLNLEGMLENHLLNELDDDLILELDDTVRENQLACLPIAKSGRAAAELVERYPGLLDLMERSKRIKIDSVTLQSRLHEREARSAGGSRAKAAFLEDFDQSPSAAKSKSKSIQNPTEGQRSPSLTAKKSAADLMFKMDGDSEEEIEDLSKNTPTKPHWPHAVAAKAFTHVDKLGHSQQDQDSSPRETCSMAASTSPALNMGQLVGALPQSPDHISSSTKKIWSAPSIDSYKLDLKDIMAQASSNHVSNISANLSSRTKTSEASNFGTPQKLSQRERKKQQQQLQLQLPLQQAAPIVAPSPVLEENQKLVKKAVSPWQVASTGPKVCLKDVLGGESSKSPSKQGSVARTPSPLNLRQTVSGKTPVPRRAVSGPTQHPAPLQQRSISTANSTKLLPPLSSSSDHPPIHSIRHNPPIVEPSLQLSMTDILSQQQTEKDIIKEAAAKRSLHEIQEEQAFQEWWDEESRKVKAQAEAAATPATRGRKTVRSRGRGGGGARGRGGGRSDGAAESRGGKGGKKAV